MWDMVGWHLSVDVESDAILPGAMGMEKTLISRISQPHEIPWGYKGSEGMFILEGSLQAGRVSL